MGRVENWELGIGDWGLVIAMDITAKELRRRVAAGEDYFAGIRIEENEVLDGINLRKVILRGAYLCYVSLIGVDLNHADFRGADMDNVISYEATYKTLSCQTEV